MNVGLSYFPHCLFHFGEVIKISIKERRYSIHIGCIDLNAKFCVTIHLVSVYPVTLTKQPSEMGHGIQLMCV